MDSEAISSEEATTSPSTETEPTSDRNAKHTFNEESEINTETNDKKPITICTICEAQNLIKTTYLSKCKTPGCNKVYCLHYASPVDPQHCLYCLSDVTCTEQIGKATHSYTDDDTGVTHSYTRRYKSINFSGLDWLFQQRKIELMTDAELEVATNYHRAILQGMLLEKDERKIAHFHRNAGKTVATKSLNIPSSTSTTTLKIKKTRVTKVQNPDQITADIAALLGKITGKGISINDIMKMVK